MSIHPAFASRILAREKLVEFRRRPASRDLTHIVIYATAPISAVVGVAEVDHVELRSPGALWRDYSGVAGIERGLFFDYFSEMTIGVAYVLKRVWACSYPILLGHMGLPRVAPQAFQYLAEETLDAVLGRVNQRRQLGFEFLRDV